MARQGSGAGKGRPTPKRSEARGGRRGPAGPPPRTRKEAAARRAAEAKSRRSEARQAIRRGDVSKLPGRLASPERVFVRDVVDARRCFGPLLLASLAVNVLAAFVPTPAGRAVVTLVWLGLFGVALGDTIALGFVVRRALRARFPEGTQDRMSSLVLYGASRGSLPRRFRLPPPRVTVGDQV